MAKIIKGGTIVSACEQFKGDVLIEGEKIVALGSGLEGRADETVDATGKYVFPGGIDGHTHFKLPFMGTHTVSFDTAAGAAVGGTTTVIDFAPQPKGMSLMDSITKHREEEADGKCPVDYSFHAILMDASKEGVFDELPELIKAGISTIKMFMAYKGTPFMCDDAIIYRMLKATEKVGMMPMLHAENGHLIDEMQQECLAKGWTDPKYHATSRPPVVEAEATARAACLAKAANAPLFIVHVSCTEAMQAIRSAYMDGVEIFGETCPHYMTLGVENLAKPDFEGAKYVCSPALRETPHHDALWQAIENGWLQVVGSDHCAFNFKEQKELGRGDFTKIPNGAPGVENRLAILYTYGVVPGKLSLQRMVDVFATAPAKFYGMFPQKGTLTVGADADIVVFDPEYKGTISVKTSQQGIDYNAYEGFEQRGRTEKVLLRGDLIVDNGEFVGRLGQGRFVEREPYGLAFKMRQRS